MGKPSTPAHLTKIGDKGVLALVCDSTNAFNTDDSGSEGSVYADLLKYVSGAKGRVVVTSFASNAARLQTLGEVAKKTKRTLCVAGRSLDRIITAAKANGYLKGFPKTVDINAVSGLKPSDVMVIATGGQGETRAALARIAEGTHPVKLDAGDTVIFSSKQIPGNEVAIGRIQNALARRDIVMITEKQGHVHVSGHPGRPELAKMYEWIRPQLLLPVHGERRHMAEQARFGRSCGVPQALVQSNGDVVRLAPGTPAIVGNERTGRLVLDGDVILPAGGGTLNERRKIAEHGVMSVAIARDRKGNMFGSAQVRLQGVPVEDDRDSFIKEACDAAQKAAASGEKDENKLREAIRLAVRRVATEWTGKKPIVDVLIIQGG